MTGQRNGQPFTKMAADGAEDDHDGQGHNPFMVHHVRVRSRASVLKRTSSSTGSGRQCGCAMPYLKALAPLR